uniref:POP4 domain-containing protein n=1 Tax=Parastrongyloides trichosuri TaxID=131310 RepID=A0A0N5A0F3_PARTI
MSKICHFGYKPDNLCLFYLEVISLCKINQDLDIHFLCPQGIAMKITLNMVKENFFNISTFPKKYVTWKTKNCSINHDNKLIILEMENSRGFIKCKINKVLIFKTFSFSIDKVVGVQIIGNGKLKEAIIVNNDLTKFN